MALPARCLNFLKRATNHRALWWFNRSSKGCKKCATLPAFHSCLNFRKWATYKRAHLRVINGAKNWKASGLACFPRSFLNSHNWATNYRALLWQRTCNHSFFLDWIQSRKGREKWVAFPSSRSWLNLISVLAKHDFSKVSALLNVLHKITTKLTFEKNCSLHSAALNRISAILENFEGWDLWWFYMRNLVESILLRISTCWWSVCLEALYIYIYIYIYIIVYMFNKCTISYNICCMYSF